MKLKKIIISSIAFCSLMTIGKVSASIDESKLSRYFPDEALNLCVVKAYNSAGLSANYDEIEDNLSKITTIECSQKGVTNTKGIGYLTGLKSLDMSRNNISTIDLSKNTELEILDLWDNELKTLELEKNSKLRSVNLEYNSLSYVHLGNKYELTNLNLSNNMLEVINLSSATSLSDLHLRYNNISSIDVSKNIALTSLDLRYNYISTIDLSKNTALTSLYLGSNKLTAVDLSKNTKLTELYLNTNNISTIDLSKNTALTTLSLNSNKLTAIDLSKNTKLASLNLKDNNFSQPTGTKYGLGKLTVGEKVSFKEYVKLPQGFKTKVSYTSSNPEIATVDENGNISGVKEGTTTITFTSKDKDGNLIYEVNEVTVTKKAVSDPTTEKTSDDKTNNDKTEVKNTDEKSVKNPETSDKGMIYGGGLTLTIGTIIAIRKKLKLLGI